MNEKEKYKIIKKLVDTSGNKKRAAIKLDVTIRTINRLIAKYKEAGKKKIALTFTYLLQIQLMKKYLLL